jgi:putative hemolysin
VGAGQEKRPVFLSIGDFEVRLAETQDEVIEAQRLRYVSFFKDKGLKGSPQEEKEERQQDIFDTYSDHLIVVYRPTGDLVGTYRLLRHAQAQKYGSFYTESEFDLSQLLRPDVASGCLELSRACVARSKRVKPVLQLLWRGLSEYIRHWNIKLLFGCGSFDGTDPQVFSQGLSYLYYNHLAPKDFRPRAIESHYQSMKLLPREEIDTNRALQEIPSLLRGYVRLGGFVGDGIFIDEAFATTDVCIIVHVEKMVERYADYYGIETEISPTL